MDEQLKQEIVQLIKETFMQDSLEVGTPAKGGALKFYFNGDNQEEAEAKLKRCVAIWKKAREEMGVSL